MEPILTPSYQLLHAKKEFQFTTLHPVICAVCKAARPSRMLFVENGFPLVQCRSCGLVYATLQPSGEELQRYYASFFSDVDDPDSEHWNHTESFDQINRIITRYLSPDDRVSLLDIGAGHGFMVRRALDLGFQSVTAIEPDSIRARHLEENHPNVRTLNGTLDQIDLGERRFSVILMLASLEHFKQPDLVLEQLRDHLLPDGIIIIRVPYLEFFFQVAGLTGIRLVSFGVPRHLFDFSPRSLTALLKSRSFRVREILPGAAERSKSPLTKAFTGMIKGMTNLCWTLSRERFMLPFAGSIVAVASALPKSENRNQRSTASH